MRLEVNVFSVLSSYFSKTTFKAFFEHNDSIDKFLQNSYETITELLL